MVVVRYARRRHSSSFLYRWVRVNSSVNVWVTLTRHRRSPRPRVVAHTCPRPFGHKPIPFNSGEKLMFSVHVRNGLSMSFSSICSCIWCSIFVSLLLPSLITRPVTLDHHNVIRAADRTQRFLCDLTRHFSTNLTCKVPSKHTLQSVS